MLVDRSGPGRLSSSGAAQGRDAKLVANWVTNELLARLAKDGLEIDESPIPPDDIAGLVQLIEEGVISSKIAKEVFEHMWAGEGTPAAIVEARGPDPGQRHRRAGGA